MTDLSQFKQLDAHVMALMNASPSGVLILDVVGRVVNCNITARDLLKCQTGENIVGRSVQEFIAPEDYERLLGEFRMLMKRGDRTGTVEFSAVAADGSRFFAQCNATIVRDESNAPMVLAVVLSDITARGLAERQLHESEEKYRSLVENIFDGICILLDERFVFTNSRFREMLGYSPDETEKLSLNMVHDSADLQRARENVRNLLSGVSSPRPREYRMIRKNGEMFTVEIVSNPIEFDGRPALQSVVRDVSWRVRNREEQAHRIALEQEVDALRDANRLMTEFLSKVSHELRTPISVVLGILEMAASGQFGEMTPKAVDRLTVAYRRGRQLASLINDLLDLATIESGRLHLHPELVAIDETLKLLRDSFEDRAEKKKIQLIVENRSARRTFVTDRDRFMQILGNLIDNALKFTPPGGRIEAAVFDQGLHDLRFTVSDTGIGIPEDLRERVFERFYQVENRVIRGAGGTGLGLSIVRELVQLLGGSVRALGAEGGGATIEFTLPRFARPPVSEQRDAVYRLPKQLDRPCHFLVIDDDPDFAALIEDAYGKDACSVTVALCGEAGLDALSRETVDLAIVDIMMPDINGLEVCRRIRAEEARKQIPILVVSAHGQQEKSEQALAAGADDFLPKPFAMWQLHERIVKLLAVSQDA